MDVCEDSDQDIEGHPEDVQDPVWQSVVEPPSPAGDPEMPGQPSRRPAGPAKDDPGIAHLGAEIAAVRALVEARLSYDATKEEAFKRLYEDLDQFRGEASFVRPLYLDLLLFLDRLQRSIERSREEDPQAVGLLVSLEEEVEEILARQGVVPMPASDGSFDPVRHRPVQIEETQDPEEQNSIARVVRRGYQWNDRVLRAEDVVVRRSSRRKGTK